MARKDRVNWVHAQLTGDLAANQSSVWGTVRSQRRGFTGRKSHLVVDNKPVPWTQTHEAFRDHLQGKQWAKTNIPDHTAAQRRQRPQLRPTVPDEASFTILELREVLYQQKTRRAPGPKSKPMSYNCWTQTEKSFCWTSITRRGGPGPYRHHGRRLGRYQSSTARVRTRILPTTAQYHFSIPHTKSMQP